MKRSWQTLTIVVNVANLPLLQEPLVGVLVRCHLEGEILVRLVEEGCRVGGCRGGRSRWRLRRGIPLFVASARVGRRGRRRIKCCCRWIRLLIGLLILRRARLRLLVGRRRVLRDAAIPAVGRAAEHLDEAEALGCRGGRLAAPARHRTRTHRVRRSLCRVQLGVGVQVGVEVRSVEKGFGRHGLRARVAHLPLVRDPREKESVQLIDPVQQSN